LSTIRQLSSVVKDYTSAKAAGAINRDVLHHHPEFWERPKEFDPELFLPGGKSPT
jgi:hypothetical protein